MKQFWGNLKEVIQNLISGDKNKIKKQIPNLLTLSRGIIAPIIVILFLVHKNLYLSIILIGISILTDFFDGWYARKHNVKSEFGALLDTICDKIFAITVVIPIISISPKMIICILILEIIISLINMYSKLKGYNTASSKIGKLKTAMLYFTILFYYLSFFIFIDNNSLKEMALYTILIQFITAIEYYKDYRKQI